MKTALLFSLLFLVTCFPPSTHALTGPPYEEGPLPFGVIGPESFAFDCNNEGPYTGVADGRIFRYDTATGWSEFGFTSPYKRPKFCDGNTNPNLEHICGRPLGLDFDNLTCDLIVADAYHGLVKIPPTGGMAIPLAKSALGVPFKFTNSLETDSENRIIYFTDSSTRFQRKDHLKVYNTGDRTGRLMTYDIRTKQVKVLLWHIKYANGIALSKNKDYVLVSEIGNHQILRHWLKGPKAHTTEVFAKFRAAPDNINRNDNGDFWVALNNGNPAGSHTSPLETIGVKINGDGRKMQRLFGNGWIQSVSEVKEHDGRILVGTIGMPYVAITSAN